MQRQMLPDRLEAAAQAAREQGLINKQQYHTLKKELRSEKPTRRPTSIILSAPI